MVNEEQWDVLVRFFWAILTALTAISGQTARADKIISLKQLEYCTACTLQRLVQTPLKPRLAPLVQIVRTTLVIAPLEAAAATHRKKA